MAQVVCVHGIAQQLRGEQSLLQAWAPALTDGVTRAGGPRLSAGEVGMAFYGDLFRPPRELLAVGDPLYSAADVTSGVEQELLLAWWREALIDLVGVDGGGDQVVGQAATESSPAVKPESGATWSSVMTLTEQPQWSQG